MYEGVRARVAALSAEVAERGAEAQALHTQLAAAAERHGTAMADAERRRQVFFGNSGLLCCYGLHALALLSCIITWG